jgi:ribosomal protein L13E
MGRAKYVLSSPDVPNPLKGRGGRGEAIAVYEDADLKRRVDAAKKAGIRVNVRRAGS